MSVRRGGLGLTGVLLVLAVLATLSARAGGPVSWQVTNGISMLPGITPGTLVVVHRKAVYEVGDVVSYRSKALDKIVLHRVVEVGEGGRMVLQGDNNTWLDPERPLPADALGARVFQLRGVGPVLLWLRRPVILGLGAALIAVTLIAKNGRGRRRRRSSGAPLVGGGLSDAVGPSHVVGAGLSGMVSRLPAPAEPVARGALGVCLALAALSSAGPLVREDTVDVQGAKAERSVTWTYAARATPGLVYPGGLLSTGDVIYPRLVREAAVTAQLDLDLPEGAEVDGSWRVDVAVENGDGWEKTTSTGDPTAVRPGAQQLTATVPVQRLLALAHAVESESGVQAGKLRFAVRAVLDLRVTADGDTAAAETTTELAFTADDARVVVDTSTPLTATTPLALTPDRSERRLHLLGASLPAAAVRWSALLGAALSALLLVLRRRSVTEEDEDARIRRTAGHLLVNADPAEDPEQVVDVDSFAALQQIASRYERVLLCGDHTGMPFYYVLDDGIAYRYYTPRTAALLDAAEAARGPQDSAAHEDADEAVALATLHLPQQRTPAPSPEHTLRAASS